MLSKNADSGAKYSWIYLLISIGDDYLKVWVKFGKRKGYCVVKAQWSTDVRIKTQISSAELFVSLPLCMSQGFRHKS